MIARAAPIALALDSTDGRHRLAARLWPSVAPRAVLVIAHGHGEHGGCYAGLTRAINPDLAIDVLAFDFRGHGLSTGRRGVIRSYQNLLDDLAVWLDWASQHRPGVPVFLFGHSNGGLVAIRMVETRRPRLAGLILSNPSLRLIAAAPFWKRAAGQVLLRVAPWVTLRTGIDGDQLTRAVEKAALIDADPLRHHRISPPTYFGMRSQGPLAITEAARVAIPTLLILGGADPITAAAAGRLFFDQLTVEDKTLLFFPPMKHEPLHEVGREQVIAGIERWLGERIERVQPG